MARKVGMEETLLSAVARKLGRAAGTLANMTQMLASEAATTHVHAGAKGESTQPTSVRKRGTGRLKKLKAKPRQRSAKKPTASRRKTAGTGKRARRKG